MNYSFYGGQKGDSFFIRTYFTTVDAMVTAFKQGNTYTDVRYGEYVLINTENKNDEDNGKLYRRGTNYTDEATGGAILVGQIVGASGAAPQVEMDTYSDVKAKADNPQEGYKYITKEGQYAPTENLVPGKDGDTYNDSIEWISCSIRKDDGSETEVYVGFKFPYTVIDYTAKSISPYKEDGSLIDSIDITRTDTGAHPYYEAWQINEPYKDIVFDGEKKAPYDESGEYTDVTKIERTDDKTHPFYEKWHITVPEGIHGDSANNFRVIVPTTDNVEDYADKDTDIANNYEILVYDYYCYDEKQNGNKKTIYLGDHNDIKSVRVADDGYVYVTYTHKTETQIEGRIKWVTAMSIAQNGDVEVDFNDDSKYTTNLQWIDDADLSEDGTLTFINNNDTEENPSRITLAQKINWIKSASMVNGDLKLEFNNDNIADIEQQFKWITDVSITQTGVFTVTFNVGDKYITNLKWIDDASIDDEGTIKFINNDDTTAATQEKKINWIKEASMLDDGTLTLTFNNDNIATVTKQMNWVSAASFTDDGKFTLEFNNTNINTISQTIKWVKDISVNTDSNQKLHVEYNDGTEEDIGEPINYIERTLIDNYHLYVLYSDPGKHTTITINGVTGWVDLGAIKDYNGVLIGVNYDKTYFGENPTHEEIIAKLNELYPNGFTDDFFKGKIITVGGADAEKLFFAFDYTTTDEGAYVGWFYLGTTSGESVSSICGKESDEATQKLAGDLPANSLWFVIEE